MKTAFGSRGARMILGISRSITAGRIWEVGKHVALYCDEVIGKKTWSIYINKGEYGHQVELEGDEKELARVILRGLLYEKMVGEFKEWLKEEQAYYDNREIEHRSTEMGPRYHARSRVVGKVLAKLKEINDGGG